MKYSYEWGPFSLHYRGQKDILQYCSAAQLYMPVLVMCLLCTLKSLCITDVINKSIYLIRVQLMGKYINQNENLNEYTMTQKVDHLYTFQYIKNIFITSENYNLVRRMGICNWRNNPYQQPIFRQVNYLIFSSITR